jgi:protoheme IX farnesyltransferase
MEVDHESGWYSTGGLRDRLRHSHSTARQLRAAPIWRTYASLTKPRVVSLLLLTTLVAMWLAAGSKLSLSVLGWTLLGGYLSAGGAEAINCYLDRELDAQMERTRLRALPSGKLKPRQALIFGIVLSLLSFFILWQGANVLAYTWWLKRRTVHNVVIGGLAGGLPPLVGWAAATGHLTPTAWLLAGIVVAWSPAHFWALALFKREEYARIGIPMLPVVYGERATRQAIFAWSVLTVMLSMLPLACLTSQARAATPHGLAYTLIATGLGVVFIGGAWRVKRNAGLKAIRRFYFSTIAYLGLLFLCMAFLRSQ